MKLFNPLVIVLLSIGALSCQQQAKKPDNSSNEIAEIDKLSPKELQNYETAYFASGCFWCVEAVFESVKGVEEVVSGYAGGEEENPTYEQVAYGRTSHAEAVEVYYNPKEISFFQLVQVFFGSHDPTSLNRQGPDKGPQYRSIAFYKDDEQKKIIDAYIKALTDNQVYDSPIVTQVVPYTVFYKAEEYHQDYERKNPNNGYIQNISVPRLNRFKKNFPEYLKEDAH
ncbi:MAG: peptide-methionine (S)-S-oxide reductase MsrA [Flavobacteriaceae bacterium]